MIKCIIHQVLQNTVLASCGTYFSGLSTSSKARSCRLWLREDGGVWDAPGEVRICGGARGGAEWADEAKVNAAGSVAVSAGLEGWGNMTDAAEMDSLETGGVANTGPRRSEAEEVEEESLEKLTVASERMSGKSEDVEHAGTEDEATSKRDKSWLDSCMVIEKTRRLSVM